MKKILALTALSAVLVTGCAANPFEDRVEVTTAGGLDVMTRNPELDAIVRRDMGAQDRFCLSPETDAVPTESVGFSLSGGDSAGDGGGASSSSGDGAASLGGRSPAVLITREVLYRTCEFLLNHDVPRDQAITLYQQALTTVGTVAGADTATGTQALDEGASSVTAPTAPARN